MRHHNGYRKLGRISSHRRAMLRNMATSLLTHERIETTLPKAKELRGIVERMITLGKRGDLHARRMAASYLFDDDTVKKVFSDLATRFKTRPGGYTRILRKGYRFGDGADMALLELVDYSGTPSKAEKAPKAAKADKGEAKAAPKKAPAKKKAAE
jgi:large subunit ribosomal protein L17